MNIRSIIALAFFAAMACHAQTPVNGDALPRPTAPLVAPVPENAQWIITIKPQDGVPISPDGAKHQLTQINSVKTGQVKRDVRLYTDGKSEEKWFSGAFIIIPAADGQSARCVDFEEANRSEYGEAGNPIAALGFPGVGWIRLERYEKVVTFNQLKCFHYVLNASTEAWIDVRNGFPVGYRAGGSIYLYRFEAPPAAPLVLPDSLSRSIKFAQRMLDRRRELQNATN